MRQAIRFAIDVPAILEAAFEGRYARANAIIPENMGLGYWADAPRTTGTSTRPRPCSQEAGVPVSTSRSRTPRRRARRSSPRSCRRTSPRSASRSRSICSTRPRTTRWARASGARALLRRLRRRSPIRRGRPCGSPATRSTSGTGCTGATPEFDRLHFAAMKEPDPAKRNEMYIEMQKLWDAQANVVWTSFPDELLRSSDGHRAGGHTPRTIRPSRLPGRLSRLRPGAA